MHVSPKAFFIFFIGIILIIVSAPSDGIKFNYAEAQYFLGPQSRALAGAGRAALSGAEAPLLNPATLAHMKAYQLGGFYSNSQIGSSTTQRDIAGIFVDHNPDAIIPASIAYVLRKTDSGGSTDDQQNVQISFGQFVMNQVALGATFHYFKDSPPEGGGDPQSLWNVNWGLIATPTDWLGLALVGYNALPRYTPAIRSSYAFGVHALYEKVARFRFDLSYQDMDNPEKKLTEMLGIEMLFLQDFQFRMGYRNDLLASRESVSTGLGWEGPKIAADYAFEQNTRNSSDSVHSVDLRIFF